MNSVLSPGGLHGLELDLHTTGLHLRPPKLQSSGAVLLRSRHARTTGVWDSGLEYRIGPQSVVGQFGAYHVWDSDAASLVMRSDSAGNSSRCGSGLR